MELFLNVFSIFTGISVGFICFSFLCYLMFDLIDFYKQKIKIIINNEKLKAKIENNKNLLEYQEKVLAHFEIFKENIND